MKGVSPLVATIILVIIALVAGALIAVWLKSSVSTTVGEERPLTEKIVIESVSYKNANGAYELNVWLRNAGKTTVGLSKLVIRNEDGDVVKVIDLRNPPKGFSVSGTLILKPNDLVEVTVSSKSNWLPSGTYYVEIVTERGSSFFSSLFIVS